MVLPPARFAWFALGADWRWLAPLPFGLVLSFIFTLYGAQTATIEPEAFSDILQLFLQNLLAMALAIVVGTYLFAWGFLNYRDLATKKPIALAANAGAAVRLMWPLLAISFCIGIPMVAAVFFVIFVGALFALIHPAFLLVTLVLVGILFLGILAAFLLGALVQCAYVLDNSGFGQAFVRGWRTFAKQLKGVALLSLLAAGGIGLVILLLLAGYLVALLSMGGSLQDLATELARQGPPTNPLLMGVNLAVNSLSFAVGAWTQIALLRLHIDAKAA